MATALVERPDLKNWLVLYFFDFMKFLQSSSLLPVRRSHCQSNLFSLCLSLSHTCTHTQSYIQKNPYHNLANFAVLTTSFSRWQKIKHLQWAMNAPQGAFIHPNLSALDMLMCTQKLLSRLGSSLESQVVQLVRLLFSSSHSSFYKSKESLCVCMQTACLSLA